MVAAFNPVWTSSNVARTVVCDSGTPKALDNIGSTAFSLPVGLVGEVESIDSSKMGALESIGSGCCACPVWMKRRIVDNKNS